MTSLTELIRTEGGITIRYLDAPFGKDIPEGSAVLLASGDHTSLATRNSLHVDRKRETLLSPAAMSSFLREVLDEGRVARIIAPNHLLRIVRLALAAHHPGILIEGIDRDLQRRLNDTIRSEIEIHVASRPAPGEAWVSIYDDLEDLPADADDTLNPASTEDPIAGLSDREAMDIEGLFLELESDLSHEGHACDIARPAALGIADQAGHASPVSVAGEAGDRDGAHGIARQMALRIADRAGRLVDEMEREGSETAQGVILALHSVLSVLEDALVPDNLSRFMKSQDVDAEAFLKDLATVRSAAAWSRKPDQA